MNGKQLKEHRLKLKLNQQEMGQLLGLGRSMINKYENGRNPIPKTKQVYIKNILEPENADPDFRRAVITKLDALNEKVNLIIDKK